MTVAHSFTSLVIPRAYEDMQWLHPLAEIPMVIHVTEIIDNVAIIRFSPGLIGVFKSYTDCIPSPLYALAYT